MVEAASQEAEEAEVAIVAKIVDEEEKDVDTTKLYEVLEVTKEATEAEIKKAFKKMTLLYHPDRPTGDEQKFKEVNAAYEVISPLPRFLEMLRKEPSMTSMDWRELRAAAAWAEAWTTCLRCSEAAEEAEARSKSARSSPLRRRSQSP